MAPISKLGKIIISIAAITAGIALFFIWANTNHLEIFSPLPKTPPPPTLTTLFFAGDIMLSRNVAGKIIEANDYSLPFRQISEIVKNADISFANLESPFLNVPPYAQQGLVFKGDPKTVEGLLLAGFDILSTANNHTLDQGVKGLDFTISHLNINKIIPSGTIPSEDNQVSPIIERHEILYGFLSYSYTAFNDAGSTHPQVADFKDIDQMKQDVLAMKGHNADVVIVSMHAGTEYQRQPNQNQIDFAHAAIDAGADLVIGHHPHWIQTIEQYQGKWIFYSLGNFVFDQMWSQDTKEGLTLIVTFDKQELKKIELKPVIIENFCCPRWANYEEIKTILEKLNLTSPILLDKN